MSAPPSTKLPDPPRALPARPAARERLARVSASLAAPWRQWQAERQEGWQALLARSEAVRIAAAHDRRLPARCHAPYIARSLDLAARYEIVDAHYRLLLQRFPARMRSRLLQGLDTRIARFALGQEGLYHLHMRAPALACAGELGLYLLRQDKCVLSSCTLTFAGRRGVLVGALHGSWSFMGRQPIRSFTRAAHGLRPKNLLLSLVYALGGHFGLGAIRAAGDAARPLADKRWQGAGQDGFWIENGGRLDDEGFYLLPAADAHRPPGQVPSKRRAARRRREALRADVREQMLFAFRYALPPAGPAVPHDARASRAEPQTESA
jgi:hypothetical protein